jgi:hypothetical protein
MSIEACYYFKECDYFLYPLHVLSTALEHIALWDYPAFGPVSFCRAIEGDTFYQYKEGAIIYQAF